MRPIVIFRFSPTEGPAHFADWLDARGLPWRLVALDAGERVTGSAADFAGIGMMGGPMSANDDLAWSAPLAALLRDAVAAKVPVIGHCLGGQLLARALGASVTRAPTAEIGWIDVDVCDANAQREWFGGQTRFTAFHWHYEMFETPDGATRVLGSAFGANQAYVLDGRHIGFQCHVEMTAPLVETWLATGAHELPLASTPAVQSAPDIRRDLSSRVAALHAIADGVYARWSAGLVS